MYLGKSRPPDERGAAWQGLGEDWFLVDLFLFVSTWRNWGRILKSVLAVYKP